MTDTDFLGYFFQLAHNLLYVYLCYFIFNTFKIKSKNVVNTAKYRMDLEDPNSQSNDDQKDEEK